MKKIVIDAGHGTNTAGKRTPAGEREWAFNNKVAIACINRLKEYENVSVLRTDDPTGKTDVPLVARTNQANHWGADVLVSIHHNANTSKWGSWGGVETFTMDHPQANPKSVELAKLVQPKIVAAMGLRDRGVKKKNLHMLRESKMMAILTEGGFMDSLTDIGALRSDAKLKAQGEAIADGLVQYFKLQLKHKSVAEVPPNKEAVIMSGVFKPSSYAIDKAIQDVLYRQARLDKEDKPLSDDWRKKYVSGELTVSDAIGLLYVMIDRNQIPEKHNKN